jgi:hypothetical protein
MRRTAFDEAVPLPPHGRAPEPTTMRGLCRWCHQPTDYDVLANLGARCSDCYAVFCSNVPPRKPVPPSGVIPPTDSGAAWAYALRWRHEQGERLTMAQVAMYREVINRRDGSSTQGQAA